LEISKKIQFPINNNLATTGHKLQGMTKQYLSFSSLNNSTQNWSYAVFSRVTTLDGLFLMQPLKSNFNPNYKITEGRIEVSKRLETLQHLKNFGNFHAIINLLSLYSVTDCQDKIEQSFQPEDAHQKRGEMDQETVKLM
jgi:hypothetical protein